MSNSNTRRLDKGIFLVSLDLELYWGVRDVQDLESWKVRLVNTRSVVADILQQFEEYGVNATWTTVGFLFSHDREELLNHLPSVPPNYDCKELSPYAEMQTVGRNEMEDPYHYGSSLVEQIINKPGQEIGTHTLSHYLCLESGQSKEGFRSDLEAAFRLATKWNLELRSFGFPRNQVNPEYLHVLPEFGIQAYRGCEKHWIYQPRARREESIFRRAARLLDAYLNLSGHHTYCIGDTGAEPPFNFPSSRLLRAYLPVPGWLENRRIARICSGLDHAARTGQIYHLWFHPEELATNQKHNARALRSVLEQFARHRDNGEMESLTMAELAARRQALCNACAEKEILKAKGSALAGTQ